MTVFSPADVTTLPAWQHLGEHARALSGTHLRALFQADPRRHARLSVETDDIFLDYSKNRVTDDTLRLLAGLGVEAELPAAIAALFDGAAINISEDRPALHTALRAVDTGNARGQAIGAVHAQMRAAVADLVAGRVRGATGAPITEVVSIGIGGSHLGPLLAVRALRPVVVDGPRVHFLANLDGHDFVSVLAGLDPERTLFLVASKSFTTLETFVNAQSARRWLAARLPANAELGRHFWAITANTTAARDFGVEAQRIFAFWDWVGGRYSLWSAIGLPIAIALGMPAYLELLAGAAGMDRHFRETPLERNLPVLLGLIGIWYANFLGAQTHAVVPYDQRLEFLPGYLQQLDMESNGKRVRRDGNPLACTSGPVIWGGVGTNSQHAFFQLLHQGTRLIPVDFIAVLDPELDLPAHHELTIANCFAQTRALMWGRTDAEARAALAAQRLAPAAIERLAAHAVFPGNAPSNTLLLPRLTARTLGALLALYEHKTFVQAAIWGINAFDQWGVELGKTMAQAIANDLASGHDAADLDASTLGLLARYRRRAS